MVTIPHWADPQKFSICGDEDPLMFVDQWMQRLNGHRDGGGLEGGGHASLSLEIAKDIDVFA